MRETDFLHEMRSDDSMAFRSMVPLDIKQWDFRPAADGQMGCILKLYREWQISGDDEFLKRLWPNAKRALEFSWKFWDADRDGVMEGEQHNTYDIEFFGANPMMTTLYLGALKAGELMALAVGDNAAAVSYREVHEKGAKNIEQLWNGEYYFQKTTPVADILPMEPYDDKNWKERVVRDGQLKYQFGAGCLSDQMLGQWFADVLGLDLGLNPERVQAIAAFHLSVQLQKRFLDASQPAAHLRAQRRERSGTVLVAEGRTSCACRSFTPMKSGRESNIRSPRISSIAVWSTKVSRS